MRKIFYRWYLLCFFVLCVCAEQWVFAAETGKTSPVFQTNKLSSPNDAVQRISLTTKEDTYNLRIDFHPSIKFAPRIHTLPNELKLLLSFDNYVNVPVTRYLTHRIIAGYFFDRFSPSSLMFVMNFRDNVVFTKKKYSKHSLQIEFKIHKKHTIIIDAGHGGKDRGTCGITGDIEKNISLAVTLELKRMILSHNERYNVVLTRAKDEFLSLEERLRKINLSNGDLLISIHTDSNPDKNLNGMSIYTLPSLKQITHTYGKSYNSKADIEKYYALLFESRRFAQCVIKFIPRICLIQTKPNRSRELRLLKTNMPAVLIEVGCISNKIDNELLHSKQFRDRINRAILYAIDEFFKEEKK